jgi:hypothetical protein
MFSARTAPVVLSLLIAQAAIVKAQTADPVIEQAIIAWPTTTDVINYSRMRATGTTTDNPFIPNKLDPQTVISDFNEQMAKAKEVVECRMSGMGTDLTTPNRSPIPQPVVITGRAIGPAGETRLKRVMNGVALARAMTGGGDLKCGKPGEPLIY